MDNRNLTIKEIEVLKRKAVEAVIIHGYTQTSACKLFGFSPRSMTKYITEFKAKGQDSLTYKKRGVKPGTHGKLLPEQEHQLKDWILSHTPDELGLTYSLWTSKAVTECAWIKFKVKYSVRGIRKLLQRLGFSSQKPIKRAYERDPIKISAWLAQTYPKIKARACQEGARIYWGDEMGIQSTDNRGRMYGLKGKTPAIMKSGSRFKCNMLAAISPQGVMNWMVFQDNLTSKLFIGFLGRLLRQSRQKIFLIVDNHRVHHSKKVMNYVKRHQEKLCLFYLPPYSPELNPQELVNQDVKAHANNNRPLKSVTDLMINVRHYLTTIQCNEFKIRGFFNKDDVAYAAW